MVSSILKNLVTNDAIDRSKWKRKSAAPVQFVCSSFYVYLAGTEGAVNYAGLRLDCEKALSGVRGCVFVRPINPNWHFLTASSD